MKLLRITAVILLAIAILGCEKADNMIPADNLEVEHYVQLLKSGQFEELNMPPFTYQDIPALLEHRNDNQLITTFPRNPISSFYQNECTLGMVILWTVESIRAVSADSKYLFMRYPSQNPVLARKDAAQLTFATGKNVQTDAAKAYFEWWDKNKHKNFNRFKDQDPLKNTPYRWH